MNKAINIKFKKNYDDFECKLDENYKKYENLFANINLKSEEEKQKIIEKFMLLCVIEKESFVSDIREAIKEIADNGIGTRLLILLIHKLQENKKKIKIMKDSHCAFSAEMSKSQKNKLIILFDKEELLQMKSPILDKIQSVIRNANFPEILFHELCHALHFICDGYEKYKTRKNNHICCQMFFDCKQIEAISAWQEDEEFYTVTGLQFDDTLKQFTYNPINQNAFAYSKNLAIRETYNKSNVYIPLERLSEFYEKIGFYDKELNIY